MRTTWWQWFWRWAVVIAALVFLIGGWEVQSAYQTIVMPGHVGDALNGVVWGFIALAAHTALVIGAPMLVIVEMVAWRRRRARRKRESRLVRHYDEPDELQRALNDWYRG